MQSPYKAIVTFTKRTEALNVEVTQTLKHVDIEHAQAWVKAMGKKIWNVEIKAL